MILRLVNKELVAIDANEPFAQFGISGVDP